MDFRLKIIPCISIHHYTVFAYILVGSCEWHTLWIIVCCIVNAFVCYTSINLMNYNHSLTRKLYYIDIKVILTRNCCCCSCCCCCRSQFIAYAFAHTFCFIFIIWARFSVEQLLRLKVIILWAYIEWLWKKICNEPTITTLIGTQTWIWRIC